MLHIFVSGFVDVVVVVVVVVVVDVVVVVVVNLKMLNGLPLDGKDWVLIGRLR